MSKNKVKEVDYLFNHFSMNDDKDFLYLLDNIGTDITINGIPKRAVITNTSFSNSSSHDDKNISTLENIKQGDRIKYNDLYWLIVSEVNGKHYGKYKGVMRACNYIIGFNINNNPVCIPVIAYGSAIGITSNQYLTVPQDEIILTMQDNDITRQIKINDRLAKWNKAYEVIGIDSTEPGLLHLHCSNDAIQAGDIEYSCPLAGDIDSGWYIVIEGETELEPDSDYSYVAKVYDYNDIEHDISNIVWSLNPEANSIIDEDGNLHSHTSGEVITIYARVEGTNIVDELEVTVVSEDIEVDVYGVIEIYLGFTDTIYAKVLINGIEDETKGVEWTITNQDGTGTEYVSVVEQDIHSITLEVSSDNAHKNKYVDIKGTYTEDAEIFDVHTIKLVSLF